MHLEKKKVYCPNKRLLGENSFFLPRVAPCAGLNRYRAKFTAQHEPKQAKGVAFRVYSLLSSY